ncbi:MAG TPA: hypothetical protein VMD53_08325 [Rhizomicrobium sp.]|nr:hypothetical protein [Rhizomicrobium sp.]
MTNALFESLSRLFDAEEPGAAAESDPAFAAELSARLAQPDDAAGFEDRAAMAALCDAVEASSEQVPADLVDAEIRHWNESAREANVVALAARARSDVAPPAESFMPLAAASETGNKAVLCRSQSGIWTLEVFVAPNDADKGYLLLSVHPDHRATYEGRVARVFVKLGEAERVLAEAVVRKGEIYTPISLEGLDLHSRDAINVTFAQP